MRTLGWRIAPLIGLALAIWGTSDAAMSKEPRAAQTTYPLRQQHVGSYEGDGIIVPTGQLIRPAGQTLAFGGRPVDLALSPTSMFSSSRILNA